MGEKLTIEGFAEVDVDISENLASADATTDSD
jgi:hypothetical protein